MATKVLVVDDEEDYRLIVKDVLQSAAMEVRTAEDGLAALEVLKDFAADAVVLDWLMPKMDGEQFCRVLRQSPKYESLPILMLTVKQSANDELDALHFGVDYFIVKPFKHEELLARVRAVLRRSKGDEA